MASSTTPTPIYGQVTVDGVDYFEQHQLFVADIQVNTQKQVFTGLRLTLPGNADFLLKGLSRDVTQPGQPNSQDEIFRFRLVNAEGTTQFSTGGLGVFDDRVVSTLCFGSGQFPYPLIPPIPIHSTGSLIYEIEDMGLRDTTHYPYIIHLGFHGAYLIPVAAGGGGPLSVSKR